MLNQEPAKFVRKVQYHETQLPTSCSLSCVSTKFSKEVAYPSPTGQDTKSQHRKSWVAPVLTHSGLDRPFNVL